MNSVKLLREGPVFLYAILSMLNKNLDSSIYDVV